MRESYDLQAKIEPLENDLRTASREKSSLQSKIDALERDLEIADVDRTFLCSTIDKLRQDVQDAQLAAAAVPDTTATASKDLATSSRLPAQTSRACNRSSSRRKRLSRIWNLNSAILPATWKRDLRLRPASQATYRLC